MPDRPGTILILRQAVLKRPAFARLKKYVSGFIEIGTAEDFDVIKWITAGPHKPDGEESEESGRCLFLVAFV